MVGPSTQAPAPRESSYAKVPTAPHGTSLSVGQADRELWCSAARDFKGGLHREKSGLNKPRPAPAAQAAPNENTESAEAGPSCVKSPAEPKRATVDSSTPHKQGEAAAGATTATTPPEPDGFIDIDEIYDDDPSPSTPSPPRRRPSSAASPIQPLTFSTTSARTPTSAQTKPSTALATTAYLKSTDPQWSTIQPLLFPQITHAIRTQNPSTNPSQPSWNQRILLYDPIVLEDLTAWLNEKRGIKIPVQRKVAKKHQPARAKSGERKDIDDNDDQEVEVKDEEVRCWMVQKWCEERRNGFKGLLLYTQCFFILVLRAREKRGKGQVMRRAFTALKLLVGGFMIWLLFQLKSASMPFYSFSNSAALPLKTFSFFQTQNVWALSEAVSAAGPMVELCLRRMSVRERWYWLCKLGYLLKGKPEQGNSGAKEV
ncbi:hypothetical protein KC341_g60 [Hortaea werneckii]|nr:hypothetical protein KC341_g60 [Hortaea werneckii]